MIIADVVLRKNTDINFQLLPSDLGQSHWLTGKELGPPKISNSKSSPVPKMESSVMMRISLAVFQLISKARRSDGYNSICHVWWSTVVQLCHPCDYSTKPWSK